MEGFMREPRRAAGRSCGRASQEGSVTMGKRAPWEELTSSIVVRLLHINLI